MRGEEPPPVEVETAGEETAAERPEDAPTEVPAGAPEDTDVIDLRTAAPQPGRYAEDPIGTEPPAQEWSEEDDGDAWSLTERR